jgi:hypothetical protein
MTSSNWKINRGGTHRMFSAIRRRFTYANVAMTLALVFAMSGGAYAASKYLITSTKQISPKVLKSLQGKAGSAGANGAQGPAGPTGPQGPAGAKGENGTSGTSGANGVSVTSSAEAAGTNCKAGGSKFVSASGTTYACNGEKGAAGQTGFSEHLPAGKTETGTWAANPAEGQEQLVGISFNIPLEAELEDSQVHVVDLEELKGIVQRATTSCLGTAEDPTAAPGNLCVYIGEDLGGLHGNVQVGGVSKPYGLLLPGVGRSGAVLKFTNNGTPTLAYGTWAVTAAE